jgi:myo-inositol catabolism protein IolC
MIEYELSLPQKNEEEMMKVVCCYHSKDFENLSESQKQTLLDHHFKSIMVE